MIEKKIITILLLITVIRSKGLKNCIHEKFDDHDLNSLFILGACNPIILIPGLFGSRLVATIDCQKFMNFQSQTKIKELKFFCGDTICQKPLFSNYQTEEYTLWPALFESPFKLFQDSKNQYNTCFAYFMRHYNSDKECPFDSKGKPICFHNKFIKVNFYGNTEKTRSKSACGTKGIGNILDSGINAIPDSLLNDGASIGYAKMIHEFKKMGYRPGFSMVGLPYDFRRFIATNESFIINFENAVKMLYKNTGKKVVVIAHSYGTLNTLNQVFKKSKITDAIERFVAITPPFLGASKAFTNLVLGTEEFKTELPFKSVVNISNFAQKFFVRFMPVSYELNLKPNVLNSLVNDKKFRKFFEAIRDRQNLENVCVTGCYPELVHKFNKEFQSLFGFLPNPSDPVCNYFKYLKMNKELNKYKELKIDDVNEIIPNYNVCNLKIYDFIKCPLVRENFEGDFCTNLRGEDLIYIEQCTKNEKCLSDYILNNLISAFEDWSKLFKEVPDSLKESKEEYKDKLKIMLEYSYKIDNTKDAPKPVVPTTVIYASHLETYTAFTKKLVYEGENNRDNVLFFGGDATVPTMSALFPALKWIYEDKLNKVDTDIRLVEYCSLIADDEKYGYRSGEDKIYSAIGCDCLKDGVYDLNSISKAKGKCSHATVMADKHLIDYLKDVVYNKELEKNTIAKLFASEGFIYKRDYFEECNDMFR
jgi:hypothetical protein